MDRMTIPLQNTLRLRSLGMAYGPRTLFSGLEVDVPPGKCLVVSGANGAGKSTLLQILAGLVRPESGRVEFAGACGYAAPDVQLYGELTGAENLNFLARLRGCAWENSLLDQVGLVRGRGGDLVSAYSSGMRQRLKLAASLLGDPPLLLWDEPTATLDESGKARADEILVRHLARGGLAVIATNDPGEADRWGDLRVMIGN